MRSGEASNRGPGPGCNDSFADGMGQIHPFYFNARQERRGIERQDKSARGLEKGRTCKADKKNVRAAHDFEKTKKKRTMRMMPRRRTERSESMSRMPEQGAFTALDKAL